jgi:hypothetical protein
MVVGCAFTELSFIRASMADRTIAASFGDAESALARFVKALGPRFSANGGRVTETMRPNRIRIRLYWRDNGPICYEARFFDSERGLRQWASDLLGSSLKWYWASSLRTQNLGERRERFGERPLTRLTSSSLGLFLQDFLYRDENGWGRHIAVFGASVWPEETTGSISGLSAAIKKEVKRFIEGLPEAPQAVVVMDGIGPDQIFVRQPMTADVMVLLDKWQLREEERIEKVPYHRLGVSRIECLMGPDA